jgi:hypothetical protein
VVTTLGVGHVRRLLVHLPSLSERLRTELEAAYKQDEAQGEGDRSADSTVRPTALFKRRRAQREARPPTLRKSRSASVRAMEAARS